MNTALAVPFGAVPHQKPFKPAWVIAACVALALHASGFLYAYAVMKADDNDVALGAPAEAIGLELTAPHSEDSNLPPGPEAEAASASSAAISQEAKAQQSDLPQDQPVESEDPDRVVAPEAKKVEKDEPNQKEVKASPTAESVASEATAPPKLEAAREAPQSVAPAIGYGDSARRVRATWQKELVAHLNRFKRYPASATHRNMTIVVAFTLDRVGHVVASSVQQGSGDAAFDKAALDMLAKADPVPLPPPAVADEGLTFAIPVIFRDKKT